MLFSEYHNIVSDHSRAERFGQMMLQEDEERPFEDVELSESHDEDEDDEYESTRKLSNLNDLLANLGEEDIEEEEELSEDEEGSKEEEKDLENDISALNNEDEDDENLESQLSEGAQYDEVEL